MNGIEKHDYKVGLEIKRRVFSSEVNKECIPTLNLIYGSWMNKHSCLY
jgi:hypothetical protein